MIERTTAPCSLHRILPSPRRIKAQVRASIPPRPQSTSYSCSSSPHGKSFRLPTSWRNKAATTRSYEVAAQQPTPFLDFLYPRSLFSSLQYQRSLLHPVRSSVSPVSPPRALAMRRLYTVKNTIFQWKPPMKARDPFLPIPKHSITDWKDVEAGVSTMQEHPPPRNDHTWSQSMHARHPATWSAKEINEYIDSELTWHESTSELLIDMLNRVETFEDEVAWTVFQRLSREEQIRYREIMVRKLAKNHSAVLSLDRFAWLASQMQDAELTDTMIASMTVAYAKVKNVEVPLSLFRRALPHRRLEKSLLALLRFAMENDDWPLVTEVWLDWCRHYPVIRDFAEPFRVADLTPKIEKLMAFARNLQLNLDTRIRHYLAPFSSSPFLPDPFSSSFTPDPPPTTHVDPALREKMQTQRLVMSPYYYVQGAGTYMKILFRIMARHAIQEGSPPKKAQWLLQLTRSPTLYAYYIGRAMATNELEYLPAIYADYRKLPRFTPTKALITCMIQIYKSFDDVDGLHMVYQDIQRLFGRVDGYLMEQFLQFFASRGDIEMVQNLWADQDMGLADDPALLRYLLRSYAARGMTAGAEQIFAKLNQNTSKEDRPDVDDWNALLRAFLASPRRFYRRVVPLFYQKMCRAVQPNSESYAIMMRLATFHGSLDTVLEIYQRAAADHLHERHDVVAALVEAYCQNNRLSRALTICDWVLERGIRDIEIFNPLISYYAEHAEIRNVSEWLEKLQKLNIPTNSDTYLALLKGLSLTGQPHKAYSLYQASLDQRLFRQMTANYSWAMDGAMRTREFWLVEKIYGLSQKHNVQPSLDIMRVLLLSRHRWAKLYRKNPRIPRPPPFDKTVLSGKDLVEHYESMFKAREGSGRVGVEETKDASDPENHGMWSRARLASLARRSLDGVAGTYTRLVERLAVALVEVGDVESMDKLLDAYRRQTGFHANIPTRVGALAMWNRLMRRDYVGVRVLWNQTWQLSLKRARAVSHSYQGGKILPTPGQTDPLFSELEGQDVSPSSSSSTSSSSSSSSSPTTTEDDRETPALLQFTLEEPYKVMALMLTKLRRGDELIQITDDLLQSGFRLGRRNQNRYVLYLLRLQQWKAAFRYAETQLMDQHHSWMLERRVAKQKVHTPSEERQPGRNRRAARPISLAVLALCKQFTLLQEAANWSQPASDALQYIQEYCPRFRKAQLHLQRSSSDFEQSVVWGSQSLDDWLAAREGQSSLASLMEAMDGAGEARLLSQR